TPCKTQSGVDGTCDGLSSVCQGDLSVLDLNELNSGVWSWSLIYNQTGQITGSGFDDQFLEEVKVSGTTQFLNEGPYMWAALSGTGSNTQSLIQDPGAGLCTSNEAMIDKSCGFFGFGNGYSGLPIRISFGCRAAFKLTCQDGSTFHFGGGGGASGDF